MSAQEPVRLDWRTVSEADAIVQKAVSRAAEPNPYGREVRERLWQLAQGNSRLRDALVVTAICRAVKLFERARHGHTGGKP